MMLVLFIMMSGLGYLVYMLAKSLMVEGSATAFYSTIKASEENIRDVMSDVSVAVENNIFDVDGFLDYPQSLSGCQ